MIPLLAAVHPAFVLRSRRWYEVLRSDVRKALRHADGRISWVAPQIILDPTPETLDSALDRLASGGKPIAVDTETNGLDPERVDLRCVGLSDGAFGVAVGFRSAVAPHEEGRYVAAPGSPPRPTRCGLAAARERLRNFFALARRPGGPAKIIVHNQVYDQPVLERHGMPLPDVAGVVDSILLHKLADSELPHDLDFLASVLTDAPKWKVRDHDAWESDADLHRYCVLDCAVTARIAPGLAAEVRRSDQMQVYRGDQ